MHRLFLSFLLICFTASGIDAQEPYEVHYRLVDKDTATPPESLGLRILFSSRNDCFFYMENLVKKQRSLGYLTFSLDSIHYSPHTAEAWIYVGPTYKWASVNLDAETKRVAEAAGVWPLLSSPKWHSDSLIQLVQQKMIHWMENNGYPFAAITFDNINIEQNRISGEWKVAKGPLYKIDSIHLEGTAKLSTHFLEQHLGIPAGSIYRKERLEEITSKLRELSFVEESSPWDMRLLGTGASLNLYLQPKRSSQINALIGFLPSDKQRGGRTIITGEVNIRLANAIGYGEMIGLNWQQLQVNSPRLNLLYQHPYLFRSGYGMDLQFDVFKKDSSFINLNVLLGLTFKIGHKKKGKLFYQRLVSNQINVDTNAIKWRRTLPEQLDVRASLIGIDYQYSGTDDAFNPRKGTEANLMFSAGVRKINKNSFIEGLKQDAYGRSFLFSSLYDSISLSSVMVRLRAHLAHHIPIGRQSTLRLAVQGGLVASNGIYRNERFQIGGYKLLRGFNEETIYTDRFMVSSLEYRYLIGQNAYLFAFSDLGWARTVQRSRLYWGNGLGLSLETKGGLLNLSYAIGKDPNVNFSLREGKIHFGFVSIF